MLETGDTIYICTGEVFALSGDAGAAALSAKLKPDPEVFGGGAYVVHLSDANPGGESVAGTVYIWVGLDEEVPPIDPPEIEAELSVGESVYTDGRNSLVHQDCRWCSGITFDVVARSSLA